MLKLATVLENPGEPPVESRYHDPRELRALGYNGLVLYQTTALSGLERADQVVDIDVRHWLNSQIEHVGRTIDAADEAGLAVYLFYDVPVLPGDVVDQNVSALTCRNRPEVICPASELALDLSGLACEAHLERWPKVAGIVLRFGDTDAGRLPHLVGNDLYSPHCARCSQFGRADRIVAVLERFHHLVVNRFDKRLIARAWNVRPNGMHDSVDLAQRVIERLPGEAGDDRFVLSFKFTQTDFWRYQQWNPASLLCGDRPIIYELQCQREFEGKGGFPNWQVPLWRDGYPESRQSPDDAGLAHVVGRVKLAGLWAWVRGGGWGGPFVRNETWIDANVFAVPRLADHPDADPAELARRWIDERLGVRDTAITKRVIDILADSPEVVREAMYVGPFARSKHDSWHPQADWIQDDLLDAGAAWRIIQRLPEEVLDEAIREKQDAADRTSRARAQLQHVINDRSHKHLEPLINTMVYAESLFEALRDLVIGLVAYRRYLKTKRDEQADLARRHLFSAQNHWNHHTQRAGSAAGAATPFREAHFWELTQQVLGELSVREERVDSKA